MDQESLFHDRVEDAIAAVIDRCGGRKKFAAEMFPDKPPRDAHNLLDACLNPERREKFSPSQVVYIMRRGAEAGCHSLAQYFSREAGYADPVPVVPEDLEAALQRSFISSVERLEQIQKQLQRVQGMRRVA